MDPDAYNRQIKQMVNFIVQEAKEKANEIYVKTEHDFALEKQLKVHTQKLKILSDYKQKMKEADTQRRIQRSIVTSEVRVRKMQLRDELVQKVKQDITTRLAEQASKDQAAYEKLLKELIIQGLIKLNEGDVEVQAREVDLRLVQKVVEPAAREYEKLILESVGERVSVKVSVSSKTLPPPSKGDGALSCAGGVKLTAKGGRIICDNTLDSRLSIAFEELTPVVRQMLFSTAV